MLEDGIFSFKSDVWSYGVVVWEIFSFGEKPFMDVKLNKDVRRLVLSGHRLPDPPACPKDICELLGHCWNAVSACYY